jgi:hypothetical protein
MCPEYLKYIDTVIKEGFVLNELRTERTKLSLSNQTASITRRMVEVEFAIEECLEQVEYAARQWATVWENAIKFHISGGDPY